MRNEHEHLLFDPKKTRQKILRPYLTGEFEPDDSTPPWIRDVLALHRKQGVIIDDALIQRALESGTHLDNTLHSPPIDY